MEQLDYNLLFRWGGAQETVDACVSEFAYASSEVRPQWAETIIFHLSALGVAGLRTEQQKALDYARQSANATSIAAEAAKRAADAGGTVGRSSEPLGRVFGRPQSMPPGTTLS